MRRLPGSSYTVVVAILASIGSLLMVLAICAVGMRWLASRVHGHGHGDIDRELRSLIDDDRCLECDGLGATRSRGELRPCIVCEGTGIQRAPF
jgi:hypothetical protein